MLVGLYLKSSPLAFLSRIPNGTLSQVSSSPPLPIPASIPAGSPSGSSRPSLSLSTSSINFNSLHLRPGHPPFTPLLSQTPFTDTSTSHTSVLASSLTSLLVPNTPLHQFIPMLNFSFSPHTPFIAPSSSHPSPSPPSPSFNVSRPVIRQPVVHLSIFYSSQPS